MKQIPNIITCLNLFSGCMACIMAIQYGNYLGAFIFIILAAVFDFFDGFAARLLRAYSDIGKQLDSLADVVSFGVAPGFMLYNYMLEITGEAVIFRSLVFLSFLLPIFAAIRLAKFNVDTRQTESFLGLPVPACGIFWAALINALQGVYINESTLSVVLVGLVIVFSILMVSELPMFSLKFKHAGWKGNEWPYSLILLSIVCIGTGAITGYFFFGICSIIVLYIILSIIKSAITPNGQKK